MADDSLPQTRAAAKAMGAKHYQTDTPCDYGHMAPRLTSCGKCTTCIAMRNKRYCDANRDAVRAKAMEWKNANRPQIAAYMAEYNSVNAERISEAKKACYWKKLDHYKAMHRRYRLENHRREIERNTQWARENPERRREIANRWALANKHYFAMCATLRRRSEPAWLTEEDWAFMLALYAEARRLTDATGVKHEVDHIIPIKGETVCGLHVPSNLQILTCTANRSKGNKYGE